MGAFSRFPLAGKRIWIAGHSGLVGSALLRRLSGQPCKLLVATHDELDLTRQAETAAWVRDMRPDVVIVAAARVGGILANSKYPADFLYDNLMIAANVMNAAHENGVNRLIWLGSSCIYPRDAAQPIGEDALLTGPLEPTNEAYAVAKIAGLKLAQAYSRQMSRSFFSVMPCNLYGPNDNFHPQNSHVIPALIRKFHEAKVAGAPCVTLWGSGRPLREFLHVDDLANAVVLLASCYDDEQLINAGSGEEVTIAQLAELVGRVVGYEGKLSFDTSMPDGTYRKVLDSSRLRALGWKPRISLEEGLRALYAEWLAATGANEGTCREPAVAVS